MQNSKTHKFDVQAYWEKRYAEDGNSGSGSYGRLAEYKADILNKFVEDHGIADVIEFGCGDGNQLRLARYPKYIGFDISDTIVSRCRAEFVGRGDVQFHHVREYNRHRAELTLSLDVLFHLVNDDDFQKYLERLFSASTRYVIIYSSNSDDISNDSEHVRHRRFTSAAEAYSDFFLSEFIECPYNRRIPENLLQKRRQTTWCDFYVFKRK